MEEGARWVTALRSARKAFSTAASSVLFWLTKNSAYFPYSRPGNGLLGYTEWPDLLFAEAISFCNDYTATYQEVYRYNDEGKHTHVDLSLRKELKAFASMWFRNLQTQGFFSPEAKRERIA